MLGYEGVPLVIGLPVAEGKYAFLADSDLIKVGDEVSCLAWQDKPDTATMATLLEDVSAPARCRVLVYHWRPYLNDDEIPTGVFEYLAEVIAK